MVGLSEATEAETALVTVLRNRVIRASVDWAFEEFPISPFFLYIIEVDKLLV